MICQTAVVELKESEKLLSSIEKDLEEELTEEELKTKASLIKDIIKRKEEVKQ